MEIAILKAGIHRSGLIAIDEAALDSMVANFEFPIPFMDKEGRVIGYVMSMERRGGTLYGKVEKMNVSASVWPAQKKISEVRSLPLSVDDQGDEGRQ